MLEPILGRQLEVENYVVMKPQDLELWARDIINDVLAGKPVEDSRVELKAAWPENYAAAKRLGGHANSAYGENILWIIGIDEKQQKLTNIDRTEKGDWYRGVDKFFDGFAPELLTDVNLKVQENVLVALCFDTFKGAPFVIKGQTGGFPEFVVPWREGTALRAARRDNLLRLLIPKRSFRGLLNELEINLGIANLVSGPDGIKHVGGLFRENEFNKAISEGTLDSLDPHAMSVLRDAYVFMSVANQKVQGATQSSAGMMYIDIKNEAFMSVKVCQSKISAAHSALKKFCE